MCTQSQLDEILQKKYLAVVLILADFDSKKHSGIIAKFREKYLKTEI